MRNRWILGRAGSGKSEYCLNEIRKRLLHEPDGPPLLLIVPEQATFQAEHALITTPGLSGSIRGQVYSFPRLAWRIMQELGGTARLPIDETGKVMLIQRLLHTQREHWQAFGSAVEKLGFAKELLALFSEFKRQCIRAEDLQQHYDSCREALKEHTALLGSKLDDLHRLYAQYEAELAKQYLDGDGFLEILAERAADSRWLRDAHLWVDGFFGFTPLERRVLARCMLHCRSVSITLCLDKPYDIGEQPNELDLFYSTAMTMVRVQEEAMKLGVPKPEILTLPAGRDMPRYRSNLMLAHLEQQYENRYSSRLKAFTPPAAHSSAGAEAATILLRPAANRKAEIEGTARHMLQLAAQGVRWREMTVMVRELESYGDLIGSVFDNYGIPFFIDQKRAVLHHPIAEFIRSALEVVIKHWRYDAVFRCIKTDFFLPLAETEQEQPISSDRKGKEKAAALMQSDYKVTRDAMDELENYVLAYGINGSRWKEERAWQMTGRLTLEQEAASSQPGWKDLQLAARIAAARQRVIEPLGRFEQAFQKAETVRERAEALYQLLVDVQAPERLAQWNKECAEQGRPEKAREHSQMWDLIVDLLDQLVEMMGDEPSKAQVFADLIDSGLDSIALGLVPPSLDQVLVGSIDRTRSTRVHYCFVLGVNDGVLPARINRDGILSENEREWLIDSGLNLADSGRRRQLDEQLLIYSVLCAPSRQLWLSYPLADEEGRSLLPSEIIRQIKAMFPQLEEKLLTSEPESSLPLEEQLDFLVPQGQALTHLTVQLKQWMKGSRISEIWWLAYNQLLQEPGWRHRVELMLQALFFTNSEESLDPQISNQLYGERLQASVSRMERFVACPFSQFASHGLRLKERQIYRLEAPDIGQLFHAALSGLLASLQQSGNNWNDYPHEQLMKMTSDLVDSLTPRLQSEILLSSSRYRYIARKLKGIVGKAATILAEHGKRSHFVPIGLELGFGPGEQLPPLSFELANGNRMDIVGRIDRVDKAESDKGLLLRVIDYKSSRTGLYLPELYYGLSLQMLTYLDVVLTHSQAWLGKQADPAGVLYFHVHNPLLKTNQPLTPDAAEKEAMKRFKMKGLLLADEETVKMMDTQLKSGHSAIVPAALKADGSFYSSASVATGEQWNTLRKFVRRKIRDIGTEITSGNVAITPYRLGPKTACDFCPYKAVCHFDPLLDGNQFNSLSRKNEREIWQQMELWTT
ncbi:PD-(D/E)XK nuclease family protein [Paenibacillus senegalensis]|uniref:PD-(D/E)XK nuclease family protein n=1 Tax=Paenibacillus senegalensis TaxID=1465766 RepID=UPI0005AB49CE|nr:PD-(D/E)XK nuclease family protein [Paenibacillus senegalensis]